MKLDNLQDVFVDVLKDLYSAETQLIKALPKMAKAATTPQLKQGFERHLATTRAQAERLEKISTMLGHKPSGKKCVGMEGLIAEGQEVISEKGDPAATDAALIVAAQKIEHYEIAGYGSAKTFAQLLGLTKAAKLLERTLEEEKKTDQKLTEVAESKVNFEAEEQTEKEVTVSAARGKKPAARSAKGKKTAKASSSRAGSSSAKGTSGGKKTATAKSPARKSGGATKSATARKNAASRTSATARSSAKTSGARGKTASPSKEAKSSRTSAKSGAGRSAGGARAKATTASKSRSSTSKKTTDHDRIRKWVEERGGHPACVKGTGKKGDMGVLRIDFPGYSGAETLQQIDWEDFFRKFDAQKLEFVYQEKTAGGNKSRFSKLVSRENSK